MDSDSLTEGFDKELPVVSQFHSFLSWLKDMQAQQRL